MLPDSFNQFLFAFERCFSAPSFQRFLTMMTGWVLCTGKRTVTGVMRSAGVVGEHEHSGYHRFFSRGVWEPNSVGLVLMRLALKTQPKGMRVNLTIDDTLGRHTGKHISSAGMHRDPLLSSGGKPFWHFGHNWVVLAVVVEFPRWNKVFSLPVLMRLYRNKKQNEATGREHVKRTELAVEMLKQVFQSFPGRRFMLIGDNAYINRTVVRNRPETFDVMGRGRMDAALYALAPTGKRVGRPRVKGERIASPKDHGSCWTKLNVRIYGRSATVKVKSFKAVWYKVSHGKQMRFVVVRDWPGHSKDDVIACTDLEITAEEVIRFYCQRWSIEETFGWVKSRLGFEDPENRTERAVQRTAPIAMWTYSLVILWYATWSKNRRELPMRLAPWYRTKKTPSFSDMLATLRRQSWTLWISDHPGTNRIDQNILEPLLDAVGYA